MRLLLDASVHKQLVPFLKDLGHDVTCVGIDYPRDWPDPEILATSHRAQRVLLTADRDFGELVYHRRQQHAGVIFLRLRSADLEVVRARIEHVLHTHTTIQDFLVVSPRSVRVRTR